MNPETVKDVAGRDVHCSGPIWRLNTAGAPIVLDWHKLARLPEPVRNAARTYAQYRIPLWAPLVSTVCSACTSCLSGARASMEPSTAPSRCGRSKNSVRTLGSVFRS